MADTYISYFSSELVDEVIEKCNALIVANPNEPRHYRNLGHAHFKKGNFAEAVKAFEKAAALTPRDTSVHLAIGRCFDLLKDFSGAEAAFKIALEQKPEWPDSHFWMGKIRFETGKLDEAITFFQESIKINPKFRDGLYSIALAFEQKGNLQEAISFLKRIIALPPGTAKTKNPFPYDLETLFDDPILLDESIRQMESFLKTHEGFADVHFKLGMAYRRKGDKEKAMAEFKMAIQINPHFHQARHYYWHWEADEADKQE